MRGFDLVIWEGLFGGIAEFVWDMITELIFRVFGWIGCLVVFVVSISLIGLMIFLLLRS
ncbi:hypothetical protein [Sphingomonas sp. MMS24-J13]|uniref:hypothetical protein n=1 Tax=Sphingomonas sp. MMS24-J13 TaxID=3238686 RepID=UPI00384EAAB7